MTKIMIIDDDPDILETVEKLLSDKYEIKTASTADEGIEKLKKFHADLVLLDVMMPGMTPKQAIPKINSKIALFSAIQISEIEKEDLIKVGNVVGFIQKPFDVDTFLKEVENLLK